MDRERVPHEGRKDPKLAPRQRSTPSGAEFAGLGLQFTMTIVIFVLGGVWLDRHFATTPWFTIGCTFAGAGGAFYSIYRRAVADQRSPKRDEE
jgi:F0F1-type ATP synthase assembly protein I